jgi:hypothetical protein
MFSSAADRGRPEGRRTPLLHFNSSNHLNHTIAETKLVHTHNTVVSRRCFCFIFEECFSFQKCLKKPKKNKIQKRPAVFLIEYSRFSYLYVLQYRRGFRFQNVREFSVIKIPETVTQRPRKRNNSKC